jgi:hypothetical protein
MNINTAAVDAAVLALLHLTLHDHKHAWRSFYWDVLGRLHARGLIADSINKSKSAVLTEDGSRESERLFNQLFLASAK